MDSENTQLKKSARPFPDNWLLVVFGMSIGIIGALLQRLGNPPNMGLCIACFIRDIAGSLGLHRAAPVQYMRPEIIGIVLGATAAAFFNREFLSRGGSAPLIRFTLGVFAMIGSLVFLGCTWRLLLRIGGGDLNGLTGLAGVLCGVGIHMLFIKRGYSLGTPRPVSQVGGLIIPVLMTLFLSALLIAPLIKEGGILLQSGKGPSALHASLWLALGAGLIIGLVGQRTRFCTVAAFRDIFQGRFSMLYSVAALVIGATLTNLLLKQYALGYSGMPISHSNLAWNFLGMTLAGLAFSMARGCPGRQLIMAGEGNTDAGLFVMGMLTGAAVGHNFLFASVPDRVLENRIIAGGPGKAGMLAVIAGLVFCIIVGLTAKAKGK